MGRNLVTWQPLLTDHQSFTFAELAKCSGQTINCYVRRARDSARDAQGWRNTGQSGLSVHVLPGRASLLELNRILRADREAIHIFCSPFEDIRLMAVILLAILAGRRYYLVSEPYSPVAEAYMAGTGGLTGWLRMRLRPLAYRAYALIVRPTVEGVFAISTLAVRQYRQSGIPVHRIHHFGYFVPAVARQPRQAVTASGAPLRILYMGSLIPRKGIDLLLGAVRSINRDAIIVHLDVFGHAQTRDPLGDVPGASYRGLAAFGHASDVISGYDYLVVPSRHDGWGVVVNEALAAHVPVICSDRVGASDLVSAYGAGFIYPLAEASSLQVILQRCVEDRGLWQQVHEGARRASVAIDPRVAAEYMWRVLSRTPNHQPQSTPPWGPESRHD